MSQHTEVAGRLIVFASAGLLVARAVCLLANLAGGQGELLGLGAAQILALWAVQYGSRWGFPSLQWRCGVRAGVIGGIISIALAMGVSWGWGQLWKAFGIALPEQVSVAQLRVMPPHLLGLMTVVAGFMGPIIEEIYFRGWWLSLTRQWLPAWSSVVIVAAAFALLHSSIIALPGLWVMGCCMGFIALRFGLTAAVIAHCIFNLTTLIAVRGGWM